MNQRLIRYMAILILCVIAASSVSAQPSSDEPQPSNTLAQQDYSEAQTAENASDFEEAIRLYGLVIEREPDFWAAYYKRGVLYAILENYELALEDYNRLIELQMEGSVG